MRKTLAKLNEEYELNLDEVLKDILKQKAKLVLLQFPDGLKPYAMTVVDYLEGKTGDDVEFLIWMDSCYGACDTPVLGKDLEKKIDLVVHFGHNEMMPRY